MHLQNLTSNSPADKLIKKILFTMNNNPFLDFSIWTAKDFYISF